MAFTLLFSFFNTSVAVSEDISNKVLRLHILANSDSAEDQDLKLKLKNYLLENTSELFIGETIDENIVIAKNNTSYIEEICNSFIKSQGYDYNAFVRVEKEFFNTRVYDDFTLPAGNYNAIKIELGEGTGHNWWCIIFPSVCLSACSESMDDYLTDEEMELVSSGYTPKFKLIEIYEKLKYKMN